MDAHKQNARQYYRPELDAVRLIAFLLVFLHHAFPNDPEVPAAPILRGFDANFYAVVDACRFGLSLFFTLSAFLIAELLLREKQAAGTIQGKQFYIRRILRIWPLYYLALVLGLLSVFVFRGQPGTAWNIGWFAIFMGSWLFVHQGLVADIVSHLWSISVEEQFYLFAPWIMKYLNRKSLYAFCALVIVSADAWLFHLGRIAAEDDSIWYSSWVQFQCFAAGILLCLVLRGRLPQLQLWQRFILLAGSLACWFSVSRWLHYPFYSAARNPGSWHLIAAYALGSTGSVLIVIAFLGLNPKLIPAWAIYLGRISFGLYVFHLAALDSVFGIFPNAGRHHVFPYLLKISLALGLTVLAAALSYRFFETPFLKVKKRHAIIESQPI